MICRTFLLFFVASTALSYDLGALRTPESAQSVDPEAVRYSSLTGAQHTRKLESRARESRGGSGLYTSTVAGVVRPDGSPGLRYPMRLKRPTWYPWGAWLEQEHRGGMPEKVWDDTAKYFEQVTDDTSTRKFLVKQVPLLNGGDIDHVCRFTKDSAPC